MPTVLRLSLSAALAVVAFQSAPARAEVSLFDVSAVPDEELGLVRGTARPAYRMTDDISASTLRQTGGLPSEIKDLWLIDVGSPLIAASVRSSL